MVWQAKAGIVFQHPTSSQAELEGEVVTWPVIDMRQGVKNLLLAGSLNSAHIVKTLKVVMTILPCLREHCVVSLVENYKTGDDHISIVIGFPHELCLN